MDTWRPARFASTSWECYFTLVSIKYDDSKTFTVVIVITRKCSLIIQRKNDKTYASIVLLVIISYLHLQHPKKSFASAKFWGDPCSFLLYNRIGFFFVLVAWSTMTYVSFATKKFEKQWSEKCSRVKAIQPTICSFVICMWTAYL